MVFVTEVDETQLLPAARRALRELAAARPVLANVESRLVVVARRQGASWGDVAADLGITRQGARQRHLAVDPIAASRSKPISALDAFYAELDAAIASGAIGPRR